MNNIGIATMLDDKTIVLDLRAESDDGIIGHAHLEYEPGDSMYDKIMKHMPELNPGMTQVVPPWD